MSAILPGMGETTTGTATGGIVGATLHHLAAPDAQTGGV